MSRESRPLPELGKLQRRLALLWSTAWLLVLAIASWSVSRWHAEALSSRLDGELALVSVGVYGLTWFDEQEELQTEALLRELAFTEADLQIQVVRATPPFPALLETGQRRFEGMELGTLIQEVLRTEDEVWRTLASSNGDLVRVHATPTYLEDESREEVFAVIVTAGDLSPSQQARAEFLSGMGVSLLLLGILGVGIGILLSHMSLAPIAQSLREREYFLAAAAHELRNPIAALVQQSDALADDATDRDAAIQEVRRLSAETAKTLDDLLLYARLDLRSGELEKQSVRMDLLIEECLGDGVDPAQLTLEAWTSEVDPRLMRALIHNVLQNAERHGQTKLDALEICCSPSEFSVRDHGPGFPDTVLAADLSRNWFAPSTRGSGLGLSLCARIAQAHGAEIELSNPNEGGARFVFRLS